MKKHRWLWLGEVLQVMDGGTVVLRLDTGFRTTRVILLVIAGRNGEAFFAPLGEPDDKKATMYAKKLFKPGDSVVVQTFLFNPRVRPGDDTWYGTVWYADGYKDGNGESWAEQMAVAGHGTLGVPF